MTTPVFPGQHRLARIQVVNWGTFQGAFSLDVPRAGLLITGPSGSGKSSLLDALSAVLVQPRWLAFNAAAQEGGTGDRSRSIVSYVRGAYRRDADEATGEVTTTYLREGATWSGIALSYEDTERTTTLVRLFHVARGSNATAEVSSLFIIAQEEVNLLGLEPYAANGLQQRRLKVDRPDWQLFNQYAPFAARFQRRLGLSSDQAQRLLHKTQSAKNLNSLDALLREFMLDEPETFILADQAVEQFAELSAAHASVVDARNQVQALEPLVDIDGELVQLDRQQGVNRAQLEHLETHLVLARLEHLRDRADRDAATLLGLEQELELARAAVDRAREDVDTWRLQLQGAGGTELAALYESAAEQRILLEQRRRTRGRWQDRAEQADVSLPVDESDHRRFLDLVCRALETAAAEHGVDRQAGYALVQASHQAGDRVAQLREDLAILLRQGSNLDPQLLRVREMLTERIGIGRDELPFAGELLEVEDSEAAWTGAIERVLRPLARTLLVPERHHAAVVELVDATHLGTRLVHQRISEGTAEPAADPAVDPRSLVQKVRIDRGPFAPWLARELASRYDHLCVDSVTELARVRGRAVTRAGQVKHAGSRYEKDDRRAVDDRSTWVLGFSTGAKEQRLRDELLAATSAAADAAQALQAHEQASETVRQRTSALEQLANLTWEEIDVDRPRQRMDELARRVSALRTENGDLIEIEAGHDRARQVAADAEEVRRDLQSRRDRLDQGVAEARAQLELLEEQQAGLPAIPGEVAEQLAALFAQLTVGHSLGDTARRVGDKLRERLGDVAARHQNAVRRAERVMQSFKTGWPVPATDLAIQFDFLPDYLAILEELRRDRLPEFEDRFFDLLQNQSRNNIGNLALRINSARRDIRARIDPINESLRRTEYGPGRYLQVKPDDRRLPEVTEFLAALHRITSGTVEDTLGADDTTEGRRRAEQRFEEMHRLLTRLASSDPADRRWRTQCLDTRLHVQFTAKVEDSNRKPLDYYVGAGGLSGGERQKLVVFCLAAALRYQLARDGADIPAYGLVVLDEAFDKTDPEFTRAGLEVFRAFGFQLLLATPMKMLQTLEDYVGGAVLVQLQPGRGSQLETMTFQDAPVQPRRIRPEQAPPPTDGDGHEADPFVVASPDANGMLW